MYVSDIFGLFDIINNNNTFYCRHNKFHFRNCILLLLSVENIISPSVITNIPKLHSARRGSTWFNSGSSSDDLLIYHLRNIDRRTLPRNFFVGFCSKMVTYRNCVLKLSIHSYNIYVHTPLLQMTTFNTSDYIFYVRHSFGCQFWFLVCEPFLKEIVMTCTFPDETKITKNEYRYYLNSKLFYHRISKSLQIPKGWSEAVSRRTDNSIAKENGQTLHRKLKIE